jgi:tRNA(fMet)-specific endonuclease VapC
MIYALDSNVVIELLRNNIMMKKKYLQKLSGNIIVIPPYVEYEVMRGIYDRNARKQHMAFEAILGGTVDIRLNERSIIRRAALIHAMRKKAGKSAEDIDILISAWAIEANAALVTENVRHFSDIPGLVVENWMSR